MTKRYLITVFLLVCSLTHLNAQLAGTSAFLQGRYLEVGMNGNGSLGACGSIPATYHPHTSISGGGVNLAEVYDIGHDGWAAGSPPYMGDYTYAGFPYEGWGIEVAGTLYQNAQSCAGTGSVTGAFTGYTNTGGRATAYWSGSLLGGLLLVNMETRIDTNASYVRMDVKLYNVGAVTLPGVYYGRAYDADNDFTWGGTTNTQNAVVYQVDGMNRVLVDAFATTVYPSGTHMSLGTVDNRARGFVGTSLTMPTSLAATFAAASPSGPYTTGDVGIGLVFNLGSIAPGDSASLSYAYIFNGTTGLDSVYFPCGILAGGTVAPDNDTICGSMSLLLDAAGYSTGSGIAYQWQSSPDSASWTDVAGATSIPYTVSSSSSTLYYRLVTTCTVSATSVQSPGVKVVYQSSCPCMSLTAGTATPSVTTACLTTPIILNATGYTASGVTYQWQSSADSAIWTDIPGATAIPYSFTGISSSTYYRVVVTCVSGGAQAFSAGVHIIFISCACPGLMAGTASSSTPLACPTTSITLSASGYTSSGTAYQWQSSPDGSSWTDIPGATTVPYSFSGLAATTHYRLVVTCTSSGATASSAGIVVNFTSVCTCVPLSAGTVMSSVSAACSTTVVTLSNTTYTSTGTSIRWQASYDSVSWTDLPVTTASYSFTGLGVTTFYRLKVTCLVSGDTVVSAGKKITWYLCPPPTTGTQFMNVLNDVHVYPNPATDQITIETPDGQYSSCYILNALGQKVMAISLQGAKTTVSVGQLPAGVYNLVLKGEQGSEVRKLVKW